MELEKKAKKSLKKRAEEMSLFIWMISLLILVHPFSFFQELKYLYFRSNYNHKTNFGPSSFQFQIFEWHVLIFFILLSSIFRSNAWSFQRFGHKYIEEVDKKLLFHYFPTEDRKPNGEKIVSGKSSLTEIRIYLVLKVTNSRNPAKDF